MKSKLQLLTALAISSFFVACSPKYAGTWTVQKYESSTPGQQNVSLSNIGTMTFNKGGDGTKDIQYNLMGTQKEDKLPFTFTKNENYITINSEGSDFAKTWIVITDKSKMQKWQSTNGNSEVQTLELIKK